MNVGLPGTGLGTLLYLVLALLGPVRFLVRRIAGTAQPGEGTLVARQALLALGIVAAVAGTGAAIGAVVLRTRGRTAAGPISTVTARIGEASPVQVTTVALTFALLTVILLTIEVGGRFVARGRR